MRKYGEQIEYLVRVVTAIIWEKMRTKTEMTIYCNIDVSMLGDKMI